MQLGTKNTRNYGLSEAKDYTYHTGATGLSSASM